MRTLAVFLLVLLLILIGCRGEAERAAVAHTLSFDDTGYLAPSPGSLPAMVEESGGRAPAARLQRLWSGSDFNFFASSPSPDGHYVTEIDWSTGDLAVRDLVTSRLHRLTDKGPWENSGDYAEVARFSPDGRRIAYGWYRQSTDRYEVRLLDFTVDGDGTPRGSNPRIVHPGGPQYVFWLYGWSEDDEILAGLYRPDNSTALGFLSVATGTLRVLKSFDWEDSGAALSPRGDLVAYDHPPGTDRHDRDIYLMAADGTSETRLTEGPGRDAVLGWVPGGGSLLFYREASGTGAIWQLPMKGAEPSGPPLLVRTGVPGLQPLGFAGQSYYFGVEIDAPRFRQARIDAQERKLVGETTLLDAGSGATVPRSMAWSPDGSYMVHEINEGPTRSRLLLSAEDGTPIEEWRTDFRLLRWMFRWTPDGEALVLPAQDHKGRAGFFRMELASGEAKPFRRFEPGMGRVFSLSPDGQTLYFTRAAAVTEDSERPLTDIVAHDLATGRERTIHHVVDPGVLLGGGHSSPLAVTPDGTHLAYPETRPNGGTLLQLLPLAGGPPRPFHEVAPPGVGEILGWDPDGTYLYFLGRSLESGAVTDGDTSDDDPSWATADVELWRVSSRGGDAETLGVIHDYLGGAVLHPDGLTLAYRSGRLRGEIWALQGLGPTAADPEGAERR